MIVVIGMDPGPKPGLVKLTYSAAVLIDVAAVQCTANCALDILQLWLTGVPTRAEVYFGVERYVDRKVGRSGVAGQRTRDLVGSALTLVQTSLSAPGAPKGGVSQNNAARVKAWATDGRLLACTTNLLEATKGMKDARDAARHALFVAVADGKCPDPYSRKARRTDG